MTETRPMDGYIDAALAALGSEDTEFYLTAKDSAASGAFGRATVVLSCRYKGCDWGFFVGEMELWEFAADAREHWEDKHAQAEGLAAAETASCPAGTTVYHCPLPDCGWTFAQPPPDPALPALPVIGGESLDDAISRGTTAILHEWYAEAERTIEAHLGVHTTLEWVTEINRLAGLMAKLGPVSGLSLPDIPLAGI